LELSGKAFRHRGRGDVPQRTRRKTLIEAKAFNLKRKAFNRKERKDVAKNAKENLERVRFSLYNTIRMALPFLRTEN